MSQESSESAVILVTQGMRVVDLDGKALGTVTHVFYDEATEQLSSFTVQHGLFGRKHKPVPAHLVKRVTNNVVTLKITAADFRALGDIEDRA